MNPSDSPHLDRYTDAYFELRARKGVNREFARKVMRRRNSWGMMMVRLGDAHLRTATLHYREHDHRERPHQGLRNEWLVAHEKILPNGSVKRRPRLGGLLNFYDREAV